MTIDTSAPAAPVFTGITTDTGSSNSDEITSDTTLVLSGTAEANSTVEVFLGAASLGTTVTNGAGNFSFDYTGTALVEGTHTFTATANDGANTSAVSADFDVVVDTSAPAQPTVTSPADNSTTSDTTPTFTGTGEIGATVNVDDGAGHTCSATVDAAGD